MKLIKQLISSNLLYSLPIINAFKEIKREDFLPIEAQKYAYINSPLSIGFNQTNSQPATVAFMLELLDVNKGGLVMEVGSGSGWVIALLAYIVEEKGLVYGVEKIQELVDFSRSNIQKYEFNNVHIQQANDTLGIPNMLFDRILVSAAAKSFPTRLLKQLKIGGIMVIPIQKSIYKVTKISEIEIEREIHEGFSFVPLKL